VTDTSASRQWPAPTAAASRFGTSSMFRQGTGEPLLALHAGGGAGTWSPYLQRLSEHFDVIAPDHPGFGRSPSLAGVDAMPALVQHYLSLLDGLRLDNVHLVGASFGGWLSAELASTAPGRVDRLVLMAPAGLSLPEAPMPNLGAMTPEQVVRALYLDPAQADAILAVPPTPEVAAQAQGDAASFGMFMSKPNPELLTHLSKISAPTLVITPEVDNVVPRQHSEAYAAAIDGAELRVLTECGHALYHEQPDLVADVVTAFLTEAPKAAT
jgi:pimeloyl-ACP methyl ester carboxylesterase